MNKVYVGLVTLIFGIASCSSEVRDPAQVASPENQEIDSPGVQTNEITEPIATSPVVPLEETPRQVDSSGNSRQSSKIYFWTSIAQGYSAYGYIDPSKGFQKNSSGITQQSGLGPSGSNVVGFSNHTQQIAYVIDDGDISLWLANLDLSQVDQVWVDTENQLSINPYDKGRILWGPNDRSVFLILDNEVLVHSLHSSETFHWRGECNTLILSSNSSDFGIGCKILNGDGVEFAKVDKFGGIKILPSQPNESVKDIDEWSFSPDGMSVGYSTSNGDLYIYHSAFSQEIKVPIVVEGVKYLGFRKTLQWSSSGEMVLVYGQDDSSSICPQFYNYLFQKYQNESCWLVIDAARGELLWSPKESIPEEFNTSWARIAGSGFDASFSPDNKLLVMFFLDAPFRYGIVVSIETDEVYQIYNSVVGYVKWSE